MVDKIGGKKVSNVSSTKEAASVDRTSALSGVGEVAPTAGVGGVRGVGAVAGKRRATRVMSKEERDHLFKLIREEADRLVEEGALPESQREVVKGAVLMAVESGILVDEGNEKPKKK